MTAIRSAGDLPTVADPPSRPSPPRPALLVGVLISLLTISACGASAANVSGPAVESAVEAALRDEGISAAAVTCRAQLAAEAGRATQCVYQLSDGTPVGASVTVTDVRDEEITVDIAAEAVPLPVDILANRLSADIENNSSRRPESTTCGNDLEPVIGASVDCAVTIGSQRFDVTVATSGVTGGRIDYTYTVKRP